MISEASAFSASPGLLAVACLIVMFGAMVQAGLGMGFGLVAAPLQALIDPILVPVPVLFMGTLTALWTAMQERSKIRWPEAGLGAIGRAIGAVLATVMLTRLTDPKGFMLVFGMLILLALMLSLSGWQFAFNRGTLFGMANLSGFMATVTSVGAPPLALLYQSRPVDEARPTMSAFFALGGMASLIGLYLSGWAGRAETVATLWLLPAMALGIYATRRIGGRFDKRFRPALLIISGVSAVVLIIRGLS